MTKKSAAPKNTVERPFKTDYAGVWCGHCLTPENAIAAALTRVLAGAGKCTITDLRTGEDIARLRRLKGDTGVEVKTRDALMAEMAERMRKRSIAMKKRLAEKRAAEKRAAEKAARPRPSDAAA